MISVVMINVIKSTGNNRLSKAIIYENQLFPQTCIKYVLLTLFITLPVETVTIEKSFHRLKIIKTNLKSMPP